RPPPPELDALSLPDALPIWFANGVLSHTRQHSLDRQLSVEYQRFARSSVTTRLVLQAQADAQGRIRLELGGHWRDRFDLLGIEPMPRLSRLSANAVQLEFDAEPEQQARIDLRLQPIQPGPVRSWIALSDGGQRLPLHQFIYP